METIVGLLALSLIVGFSLGRFSWLAIAISSAALAVLALAVLQGHGFELLPGAATIVACLASHQLAYLAVLFIGHRSGALVQHPRHNPAVAVADALPNRSFRTFDRPPYYVTTYHSWANARPTFKWKPQIHLGENQTRKVLARRRLRPTRTASVRNEVGSEKLTLS